MALFRNDGAVDASRVRVTIFRNEQLCRPAEAVEGVIRSNGQERGQDFNALHRESEPGRPESEDIYRLRLEYRDGMGDHANDFCVNCTANKDGEWVVHWAKCTPGAAILAPTQVPC